VRDRSKLITEYENQAKQLELSQALTPFGQDIVSIQYPIDVGISPVFRSMWMLYFLEHVMCRLFVEILVELKCRSNQ